MSCDTLSSCGRTANKDHKCTGCLGTIPKGTKHQVMTGLDDGLWWRSRLCAKCFWVLYNVPEAVDPFECTYLEGELAEFHGEVPDATLADPDKCLCGHWRFNHDSADGTNCLVCGCTKFESSKKGGVSNDEMSA